MNSVFHIRRLAIPQRQILQLYRAYTADSKTFKEGDIVLLRPSKDPSHSGILTKPLNQSQTIQTKDGALKHSAIIGRRVRDPITSLKGTEYRVYEPSLAEYVSLTPRIVTPIYPAHGNLIVSLLDLHVSAPGSQGANEEPLEILEAGTGHGALTLHLARAIHGANSPPPPVTDTIHSDAPGKEQEADDHSKSHLDGEDLHLQQWQSKRQATIHTVDISAKHSAHARTIVKNFRHGMYYNNVNFNVGDLPDFFSTHKFAQTQFLSHVILDMPSAESRLQLVSDHMRVDGKLLVFNPSVTQIAECVQTIKDLRLPLILEHVLELGGGQSGAREWDVRIAKIRSVEKEASQKASNAAKAPTPSFWRSLIGSLWGGGVQHASIESKPQKDWAIVCRPKYTDRIVGGGFLGVWRRMRDQ